MGKYLTLFENHSSYEEYIDGPDAILPNVSYCKDEGGGYILILCMIIQRIILH